MSRETVYMRTYLYIGTASYSPARAYLYIRIGYAERKRKGKEEIITRDDKKRPNRIIVHMHT